MVGLNFRMTEVTAAIARCQLAKLDVLNEPRIALAELVSRKLQGNGAFSPMPKKVPQGWTHVYYVHLYNFDARSAGIPIRLFAEAVSAEGIPLTADWATSIYGLSVYRNRSAFHDTGYPWSHPAYRGVTHAYGPGTCPVSDAANAYTVCSYNVLRWPFGDDVAGQFVSAVEKVLSHGPALIAFDRSRAGRA
jgi:dTDP-4-amino-4,6-dideoxygalactose transaminase